mmetsp:Transcript_76438/g.205811  ORF Transcript_76438/g.205811 Transcript_76438/m.205811 type:complete len:209 (-) Transcript_76438:1924-2550(-)
MRPFSHSTATCVKFSWCSAPFSTFRTPRSTAATSSSATPAPPCPPFSCARPCGSAGGAAEPSGPIGRLSPRSRHPMSNLASGSRRRRPSSRWGFPWPRGGDRSCTELRSAKTGRGDRPCHASSPRFSLGWRHIPAAWPEPCTAGMPSLTSAESFSQANRCLPQLRVPYSKFSGRSWVSSAFSEPSSPLRPLPVRAPSAPHRQTFDSLL